MAAFRTSAREALLPRDAFGRAVLALVVLRTPVVWLTAWLVRHEPLAVTAMYRPGGDVQYFELVAALGRGNLGESNVHELAGQGLHPFPLGSVWLHSLLFALGGPWGMLLADTVVTVGGYLALVVLARACLLTARAAAAFGGFVCGYLYVVLTPLTDRFGWMRDLFWGDRFPRPFLTEIYVALSLAVLVRLWLQDSDEDPEPERFGPPFWAFAGLMFSLLVQSDIYSAFIVGLGYAFIVAHRFVTRPERRAEVLRGAAVMVLVLLLTAWPFALQRLRSTPELLVRWGVYPLSRLTALAWVRFIPLPGPLLVATAAAAVLAYSRRRPGPQSRIVAFWCLLTAVAALAFPLFFGVLGQGLYPYMFPDRLRRMAMLALAFIVLTGVRLWWPTSTAAKRALVVKALAVALLVAMAGGIGARALENVRREDHVRTWYKLGEAARYRTAFTELVRELDRPAYKSAVVLGTLDQEVHVHWQTFAGGRSFVPDGFVSIAPDREIERRFALFCKLLAIPTDDYLTMLAESGPNGLLFVSKYGANRAYTLAPLSEYTETQQRKIAARTQFVSFAFELPRSEIERFRRLYEDSALRDAPPRLDLVVLNNDPRSAKLSPPAEDFDLAFQNPIFRLYARKGLLP